jgi:hypothetical protein
MATEVLSQPVEAVRAKVDRVLAWQEITRLGKQPDYHAHDDPRGRAVDILRADRIIKLLERRSAGGDEFLDGLANTLTEDGGKFRLPFARILDGGGAGQSAGVRYLFFFPFG